VKALCAKAREILVDESNVQRVDAPVTVRRFPRDGASSETRAWVLQIMDLTSLAPALVCSHAACVCLAWGVSGFVPAADLR